MSVFTKLSGIFSKSDVSQCHGDKDQETEIISDLLYLSPELRR